MIIENTALPEIGYIEKVINVEKLENDNFQIMVRAFPTRKRKVQNITMEFSPDGFNELVGSLMIMAKENALTRPEDVEKYCIVVGRQLESGIFWQVVWYSEKYNLIHLSQLKDEDKTDPESELAQYFSMNKCYEIIVDQKLKLTGDYVVIKQAGTESQL